MKSRTSLFFVNLSFALAILILTAIVAFAGFSLRGYFEGNEMVGRTLNVLGKLNEMHAKIADAESGVRGYVITGDETFLDPYYTGLDPQQGVSAQLAELRELTADNPGQQARLDRLQWSAHSRLESLSRSIELYKSAGFDAAQEYVASGRGKEEMEAIRAVIEEMYEEEFAHLQTRSEAASKSLQIVLWMFAIGAPFALFIMGAAFYLLNRQIVIRRQAEESLRRLNEELDRRVSERTAALAESERNYRDLADNSLVGIAKTTLKGEIVYANHALARMMGFDTPQAMIQVGSATRWKDPQARLTFLAELQETRRVESYETVFLKSSGEPVNVILSAQIGDEQMIGTFLDITERKRAEEEVIRLAYQSKLILKSVGEGIYGIDTNGIVTFVNPAAARFFGEPMENLIGVHGHSHHHHTRADGTPYPLEECPIYAAFHDGATHQVDDEVFWRADGTSFPVEYTSTPIHDGDQIIGAVVTFKDITERKLAETERKRAEEAIRKSEERYRSTLDNLLEGAQILGFDWRYLYINATAEKHNNRPSAELLGQKYMEMWPGIESTAVFRVIQRCMAERTAEHMENQFTFPDGAVGWFELDIQPVPEGIFILSADITERKLAEQEILKLNTELEQRVAERTAQLSAAREAAERANRAKSEFLSRMSHELRTPLNAILGFTQVLQMDGLTPDQTNSLRHIIRSGRHLLSLINEVLDIARIESGNMNISPEPVQVDEAIQETVDLIRPLADQRGISIQVKIPSSRDVFVTADRQRFKQVLLNLLSNAVKYNRAGGQIHITASLLVDGFLRLEVRDTGEGIPPEKMERLFTAFDRLGMDPERVEGTGLGLALSKGLVEAMGGRIGAQSVPGEGSAFWLDLKLTTEQEETVIMAEVDDHLQTPRPSKKGLVMYVEDNLSNIHLIEKVLARLSPDVKLVSAMQGQLAMDLARQHKPELILLDLHLPDLHGGEVLKRLRAEAETKDIPIVIMSADATPGQIKRMLAAGANAYLTKPIDVKEFLKLVEEVLVKKSADGQETRM